MLQNHRQDTRKRTSAQNTKRYNAERIRVQRNTALRGFTTHTPKEHSSEGFHNTHTPKESGDMRRRGSDGDGVTESNRNPPRSVVDPVVDNQCPLSPDGSSGTDNGGRGGGGIAATISYQHCPHNSESSPQGRILVYQYCCFSCFSFPENITTGSTNTTGRTQ